MDPRNHSHLAILTIQFNGGRTLSHTRALTPKPGQTRLDIYDEILAVLFDIASPKDRNNYIVLFFDVQSMKL